MENFGELLKKERLAKRKTLRQLGAYLGKSIGYLSDVEQSRKSPPNLETVRLIEEFLGIEDGRLVLLASKLRRRFPEGLRQRVRTSPQLAELLLRVDDYSDEELEALLSTMRKSDKS